jgi:type IV pilus assembly protein PilE
MNSIDRTLYRLRARQIGFSLIELMVVVAIIAILTIIAYPSYLKSVREGRRGQAKTDLVTLANNMERCFTQQNSYAGPPACALAYNTTKISNVVYYNIALSNVTPTTFTITATPAAGTDQAKDVCGALSVDQAGTRLPVTSTAGGSCF